MELNKIKENLELLKTGLIEYFDIDKDHNLRVRVKNTSVRMGIEIQTKSVGVSLIRVTLVGAVVRPSQSLNIFTVCHDSMLSLITLIKLEHVESVNLIGIEPDMIKALNLPKEYIELVNIYPYTEGLKMEIKR